MKIKRSHHRNRTAATPAQRRQQVQKWTDLVLSGLTSEKAAERLHRSTRTLTVWAKEMDLPTATETLEKSIPDGPWQMTFKGKTWKDMSGTNNDAKKLNFFFFRRGIPILNINGK